jgi:hypothetical protein
MSSINTSEEVRNYLASKPPLTVVTPREIYDYLISNIPNIRYSSIRTFVQRVSFNAPLAERERTVKLYAIYLDIPEMEIAVGKPDLYLTLPGIEREYIDRMPNEYIESAQRGLYVKYGERTVKFWVQRAQLNVGVSKSVKDEVRRRDKNKCRICTAIERAYVRAGNPPPSDLHTKEVKREVSHIISRASIFWHILEDIDEKHGNIFCDEAVEELETRIAQNGMYSEAAYLAFLCKPHDSIIEGTFKGRNNRAS